MDIRAVIPMRRVTVEEYGCTRCQRWHDDRTDRALYRAHLMWQSKHGPRSRMLPDTYEMEA